MSFKHTFIYWKIYYIVKVKVISTIRNEPHSERVSRHFSIEEKTRKALDIQKIKYLIRLKKLPYYFCDF